MRGSGDAKEGGKVVWWMEERNSVSERSLLLQAVPSQSTNQMPQLDNPFHLRGSNNQRKERPSFVKRLFQPPDGSTIRTL